MNGLARLRTRPAPEPSLRSEIRTKVRFRTTLQWVVIEGFPFSSLLLPEFPFPECVQMTNENIVQLLNVAAI